MIKFDVNKGKTLSFGYQAENIQPENLEYYIRLSDDEKLDYGIKGERKQNQLVFNIPPLNEFIEGNLDSINTIKMEIHDKGNRYYLKPFEDEVQIEREPQFDVNFNEEQSEKNHSSFFVTEMQEEDDEKEKSQEVSEKEEESDKEVEEEVKESVKEKEKESDLHTKEDVVESNEKESENKKKKRKNKKLAEFLDK